MRPLLHRGTNGLTEVEPRPSGHAYVRWYRYPLAPLRPDGVPTGDHQWSAALEMDGTTLSAYVARGFPSMHEFRDILTAAALLGAEHLCFEHRDRLHKFSLSKYKPANQNKNTMTVTITITATDDAGKKEVEVTGQIFNLDGKEASATIVDALSAVTSAIGSFDAQTGSPV